MSSVELSSSSSSSSSPSASASHDQPDARIDRRKVRNAANREPQRQVADRVSVSDAQAPSLRSAMDRWDRYARVAFHHTPKIYLLVTTFLLLVAAEQLRLAPEQERAAVVFQFVLDCPQRANSTCTASCDKSVVRLERQQFYLRQTGMNDACSDAVIDFVGAEPLGAEESEAGPDCTFHAPVASPNCTDVSMNFPSLLSQWLTTRYTGSQRQNYHCTVSENHGTGGAGASLVDFVCGHFRKLQASCRQASFLRRTMNVIYGIFMLTLYPAVFANPHVGSAVAFLMILLWALLNVAVGITADCDEYSTWLVSVVLIPFCCVMLVTWIVISCKGGRHS